MKYIFLCNMSFIDVLAKNCLRVFSYDDAAHLLKGVVSESYSKRMLYAMAQKNKLQALGNGLYALPTEFLSGGPIHSFEIGMKLVKVGAISHRSAMFFHEMTDQVLNRVYLTSPRISEANLSGKKQHLINGSYFQIKRVEQKNFFGIKRYFIGEAPVWITDIEKTLLDGLSEPDLCGGFREVMHAFSQVGEKIDSKKFIEYVNKMPCVIAKRSGWVLEKLEILPDLRKILETFPIKTIQKLNPKGSRTGSINKHWMIMENL